MSTLVDSFFNSLKTEPISRRSHFDELMPLRQCSFMTCQGSLIASMVRILFITSVLAGFEYMDSDVFLF